MAISRTSHIDSLPNELFWSIFQTLFTHDLLSLARTNRRFHSIVSRILHNRMLSTSCLPENELILECYHPSAKISTPYLSCQYLGLKAGDGATAVPDDGHNNDHIGLTELGRLYSAFRPRKTEENRRRRGIWFSRLAAMTVQPRDDREDDVATQDVYLDEGELFSQLCTATNVVKEGSKKGFFINHVNISEGVVRVWRGWLLSQATGLDFGSSERSGDGDQILWVDTAKTVGLKFQVEAGPADTMPLISDLQDEPAVQYRLTYEEVLVRTGNLLMAVEQGNSQDMSHEPNAVIIASI